MNRLVRSTMQWSVGLISLVVILAGCGTSSPAAGAAPTTAAPAAATVAPAAAPTTAPAATVAPAAAPTSAAPAASTPASAAPTTAAAPTAAAAVAGATTILVATDPKLGQILTDGKGMTLYWYTKDTANTSTCTGGCLKAWPAFTASQPLTLPSGTPGKLDLITRTDDATQQVTYNGFPLYYWAKDAKPGDTTGQGVGKVWYVVNPTADALKPPAAQGASSGY